jgi:hypothetical protein
MVRINQYPTTAPARWLLLVGLWLISFAAVAAELTARLDRTEIVEGETVTLIIQTDDPAQSLEADLSNLEQGFDVLDRRSETQMSIVNGRQTAVVRLLLTLEPRRTGTLLVPPLQFPGAATEPLTLKVEPAPELAPGEMPPVFIEMSMNPPDGPYYVHSQLSLTVKIFYQQNLTEASINPPAPEQASVRLLDEVPYPAERNGTRYRVLQRSYAIFPERSGSLVIPPLRLTGRLIERSGNRLWQPSVRGRRITEESEPLTIEIQPRPAGFAGDHWLPARELSLSQQLTEVANLRVGEPVTRTVIIDAVGLEENMLEEPVWPELPDARIYPDQPQGISRDDGQWVRGHKEFRYAVVPEQAGTLVLPELRLDWWDTVNDQPRTALLPQLEVEVAPLQLVPQTADTLAMDASAIDRGGAGGLQGATRADGFWRNAALVLAVLWIGTLVLLIRSRGTRPGSEGAAPEPPSAEADLVKALQKACLGGDATETRRLLRRWLRLFGPSAAQASIREFAGLAGAGALRDALEQFENHGYDGAAAGSWSGASLWQAFSDWRTAQRSPRRASADGPPDLYAPSH